MLSVISLLNEPNTFSPANVDASVMYRRWKESKGKDKEYENIIRYISYLFCVCVCMCILICFPSLIYFFCKKKMDELLPLLE